MNHLAHLFLAEGHPEWLAGAFLGDVVKGQLNQIEDVRTREGIELHRVIDAFTDSHTVTHKSRLRFQPHFRRYGGIMTDIAFDHFLSSTWSKWDNRSMTAFSDEVFTEVLALREQLPPNVVQTCERMRDRGVLQAYASDEFVARSYLHLSTRLTRSNPLNEAFAEFEQHKDDLAEDFEEFFPELISFCHDWKHDHRP